MKGVEIGCPMVLVCIAFGRFGILLILDPKKSLLKVYMGKGNFLIWSNYLMIYIKY